MTKSETYVTFVLDGQTFGVDVRYVREIIDKQRVIRLPNTRPDCAGVIDTRGSSIPLTDLAGRLGFAGEPDGPDVRIIVFEQHLSGRMQAIAVKADRVLDVIQLSDDAIEPSPEGVSNSESARAIRGLARLDGDLVVLIDIARFLFDQQAEHA